MIPHVIRFLAAFGSGKLEAMYKTSEYLGFLIKLSLAFGIVFELPVVSFILSRLGVIGPAFLIGKFRYAIIAIFVLAAFLTPPDILSQAFLAGPLLILYGLSILVSYLAYRRRE